MHRLLPVRAPTGSWSPKLSPGWVRFWRPFRRLLQRRWEKLHQIEVRGLDHLRGAVESRSGVLITPNHVTYSDPFLLFEAADQVGRPFYFMTAWQVLGTAGPLKRRVLRQHGCFSVNRDGTDFGAFRQAVDILKDRAYPLVIFPEGEMYHLNDRITPFREGPAAIALAAAKRAERPIVCIPCGLKYYYRDDPTPDLVRLMDRLERAVYWRPRPELPLVQRIYRLAEAALALKEIEHLGQTAAGLLTERIAGLGDHILKRLEQGYGLAAAATVPERVKALRQHALEHFDALPADDPCRQRFLDDLDDVFLVVQLFAYPGDYVTEQPSIERIAETLDKFEEDILGVPLATLRGTRGAVVTFGEPVPVEASGRKAGPAALTQLLEQRVQALLDATVIRRETPAAEAALKAGS